MRRLPAPALVLTACALLGGAGACGAVEDARDGAGKVQDCAGLARDALSSGLSGLPTAEEAEQAVQRLDDRVQGIGDTQVRDAASSLRDRLQDVLDAARSADRAAVEQAVGDARDAAASAAGACGLPVDQFTG